VSFLKQGRYERTYLEGLPDKEIGIYRLQNHGVFRIRLLELLFLELISNTEPLEGGVSHRGCRSGS
jgi:hypothetical protein